MDIPQLATVLSSTFDPNLREEAEKKLNEIHKMPGFVSLLLQVVMSNEVQIPVRQSGGIYLKNMISQYWKDRDPTEHDDGLPVFVISDQDKATIRENIVEAVIHAPELIRLQLTVCVSQILRHDFPEKWPAVVDKVNGFLAENSQATWMGALLTLYQIVKKYEFKKPDERQVLHRIMQVLLPQLLARFTSIIEDASQPSVEIQKQILKIFFALIQYGRPIELMTSESFGKWMHIFHTVVARDVPQVALEGDEEELAKLPWVKAKKVARHILCRVFERLSSLPIRRPANSGRSRFLGPPVTSAGFGKRPAPGVSFIKPKHKKRQASLVKDFIFSSVDEEGQMYMLSPISINLTEVLERFGELSTSIICSAIEQELRDQGEVVRLVVIDAKGHPIMDSSQTRKAEFWASQRTFRTMSQQTFRKWKPVWAALSTGPYTLEDDTVADETSGDNEDLSTNTCTFAQNEDKFTEIKNMFKEIKDALEVDKEKKSVKEVIKCVICQSTCTASLYFCVAGCGQLIGCFYCVSKLEDCPLCRVSLPDAEIRKPLKISGLAEFLGIPDNL